MIDIRKPTAQAADAQLSRCGDPYLAMLLRSLNEPAAPPRGDLANPVHRDRCGGGDAPPAARREDESFVILWSSEPLR